jgi:hypothetical protein
MKYQVPSTSPQLILYAFLAMQHHRVCLLLTRPLHEYEEKQIEVTVHSTLPGIKIYQAP